jgi:AraC-like DNA-binding protein
MLKSTADFREPDDDLQPSPGRAALSFADLFEDLKRHVPATHSFVVSTVPRGGLQIVQPSGVSELLLRAFQRDFHTHDRVSWQAILKKGKPVTGSDAFGSHQAMEASRYYTDFLQNAGLKYVAAVSVENPVLEGYVGAWHLYRTESQGAFTSADLQHLAHAAKRLSEHAAQHRRARHGSLMHLPRWQHTLSVKQIVFGEHAHPLFGEESLSLLDDTVIGKIRQHVRSGATEARSSVLSVDRLQLSDATGDAWVFRQTTFPHYAALGSGPVTFINLQPTSHDWAAVRVADVEADPDVSRLVPAMHFMQQEFHRGPTLNEIARSVHLSPFHFHRRFTELIGTTPKHFLLECQIFAAKSQLVAGDRELVSIASACGFAHQSHFTSRFKQATGLTPTRWRKVAMGAVNR